MEIPNIEEVVISKIVFLMINQ